MKTKRNVKCLMSVLLVLVFAVSVSACGKSGNGNGGSEGETKYAQAVDVLNAVLAVYEENDKFAVAGGDMENAVMDGPGKFDVSKTEELDMTLGLPADQASSLDDAASMVHMMNANTFTGGAYRLKDGTDVDAFADAVKENIKNRQWMCGFPDTLLIIRVDGSYVITAFGNAEIMDTFKANALSALDGAEVLVEEPIM
ncbi:MAG: hypothetical protein HFI35_06030 [Roseburia sp.]|jgi:hypothetical protein|nr:hypothetical protein [Roseburia sp.]